MDNSIIEMRPRGTFLYDGFVDFCKYLQGRNCKKILEIGSYIGESANLFKEYLGEDTIIVSIDPWHTMPDENDLLNGNDFSHVEREYNNRTMNFSNFGKMKFRSQDIPDLFSDGYFDCLYIDGLHTEEQVYSDIENYWPKVHYRGIIAGHDYDIGYDGRQEREIFDLDKNRAIRQAVTRAVDKWTFKESLMRFGDSSWATEASKLKLSW